MSGLTYKGVPVVFDDPNAKPVYWVRKGLLRLIRMRLEKANRK